MPRKGQKLTTEQIEKIRDSKKHLTPQQRENIAAAQRGKKVSQETRAKMSSSHVGHLVSDKTRAAIGNAHRGKVVSPETGERIRRAKLGTIISPETRAKMSAAHSGRVMPEDFCQRVREGLLGKAKSESHKENISKAKQGITPQNLEILKASRIGKENSDYQKQRASEANTGPVRSEESKELNRIAHIGVFPSEETRKKISENRTGLYCGEENHMWKGGTSFLPYCYKFNERRKIAVRKFFGDKCLTCSKEHSENIVGDIVCELSVHHVDHDKEQGCNGKPFNLVPLCHECHNKELSDIKGFQKYINKTLEDGFEHGIWSREQYEREVMYPE